MTTTISATVDDEIPATTTMAAAAEPMPSSSLSSSASSALEGEKDDTPAVIAPVATDNKILLPSWWSRETYITIVSYAYVTLSLAVVPVTAILSWLFMRDFGPTDWVAFTTESDTRQEITRIHTMSYYAFLVGFALLIFCYNHATDWLRIDRRRRLGLFGLTLEYIIFWAIILLFQALTFYYWYQSYNIGNVNFTWRALGRVLGTVSGTQLGLTLIPMSRYNPIAQFLRINFDGEALAFHKTSGAITVILSALHLAGYTTSIFYKGMSDAAIFVYKRKIFLITHTPIVWQDYMGIFGFCSYVAMFVAAIFSFSLIRRLNYDIFKYSHALMIPAVVLAGIHASTVAYNVMPGLFLYVIDLIYRIITPSRNRITFTIEPNDSLNVIVHDYRHAFLPGQVVNLRIPALSYLVSHPFTIVSRSPDGTGISLLIRPAKDTLSWSVGLMSLVKESNIHAYVALPQGLPVDVPSSVANDDDYATCTHVVAIATGGGVSAALAITIAALDNIRPASATTDAQNPQRTSATSLRWLSDNAKPAADGDDVKEPADAAIVAVDTQPGGKVDDEHASAMTRTTRTAHGNPRVRLLWFTRNPKASETSAMRLLRAHPRAAAHLDVLIRDVETVVDMRDVTASACEFAAAAGTDADAGASVRGPRRRMCVFACGNERLRRVVVDVVGMRRREGWSVSFDTQGFLR